MIEFEANDAYAFIRSEHMTYVNLKAKHCYYKYNEFFRCEKFHGQGAKECFKFKQAYFSLCPKDWVRKNHHPPADSLFCIQLERPLGINIVNFDTNRTQLLDLNFVNDQSTFHCFAAHTCKQPSIRILLL